MKIKRAFTILFDTLQKKKEALLMLLGVLCIISLVLAILLYIVEKSVCNTYFTALKWVLAQYIGNPCNIAMFCPTTTIGTIIVWVVGFVNVFFVAGITGIIGVGFFEGIEERQHARKLLVYIEKIGKAFKHYLDSITRHHIRPQCLTLTNLQVSLGIGISENDLIEVVKNRQEYRFVNIGITFPVLCLQDTLAVEYFRRGDRLYGCCINRKSPITIISPTSLCSPGIGSYGHYLAKWGNFNYISREVGEVEQSFVYIKSDEKVTEDQREFLDDIGSLRSSEEAWMITLLPTKKQYDTHFHFTIGGKKGDETLQDMTDGFIQDKAKYLNLYHSISTELQQYNVYCDNQRYFGSSRPDIFVRHLNNRQQVNHIILYIDWQYILWSDERYTIVDSIVKCIKNSIK